MALAIARRMGALVPLVAMTALWAIVVRHAWRIRSIVVAYETAHGEARWPHDPGPWPEHLQRFHDDLVAVGAGYFYPFGAGMLIAIALLWVCALAFADPGIRGFHRWLAGAGLLALLGQLILLTGALQTYVHITD